MKKNRLVTGIIAFIMVGSFILIVTMQCIYLINSYKKAEENIIDSTNEAITKTAISNIYTYIQKKIKHNNNVILNSQNLHKSGHDPYSRIKNYGINNNQDSGSNFPNYNEELHKSQMKTFRKVFIEDNQSVFKQIFMKIGTEALKDTAFIENRYDFDSIQNMLQNAIKKNNFINLDFEFAITDSENNIKIQSDNFNMNSKYKYKYNLVPEIKSSKHDVLHVEFLNVEKCAFDSIYTQLITSILLTILLAFTLIISFTAFMRQRKLAIIKNNFINNMTHEFKTPIATIKIATSSLKNLKAKEDKKMVDSMLNIIDQETNKMNEQIEQVLQLAILDKKNLEVKKHKENINEVVADVVSNFELVIKEKGGSITLIVIDEDVYLNIDKDLIANALSNLIDNAIKYSNDAPEIKVTTFIEKDKFHIAVKDSGIGISKDVQSKIFDKFYRASTGNVHNVKGFGLGLNYVREIIYAHKGSVIVRSCLGKGSTFTTILPLK